MWSSSLELAVAMVAVVEVHVMVEGDEDDVGWGIIALRRIWKSISFSLTPKFYSNKIQYRNIDINNKRELLAVFQAFNS